MSRIKVMCLITGVIFGLAVFCGPAIQGMAMAESRGIASPPTILLEQASPPEEETPEEDRIEFDVKYPALSAAADSAFEFEVDVRYLSADTEARDFDLSIVAPEGWITYACESKYATEKEISAVRLEPYGIKQSLLIMVMAPFWLYPEPGDYTIKLVATSGEITGSVAFTAKITARYDFSAATKLEGGRLNIKAESGKESYLPISVTNTGTAPLDKITLSSNRPGGWSVTFNPEKIEALSPGASQEVEVVVKPPEKTIAGDYTISLKFAGEPSSHADDLAIRVTVGTSTKWGLVGVGIVVAIIAGLAVTFMRLGRR
jgi:uncharacterized membrane protein